MEVVLRCPAGHVSRLLLGNVVEYFDMHCSECRQGYHVRLLSDGSWIVMEKGSITNAPWTGEAAPDDLGRVARGRGNVKE